MDTIQGIIISMREKARELSGFRTDDIGLILLRKSIVQMLDDFADRLEQCSSET